MFVILIALPSCIARSPWVQVSDVPFDKVKYDSGAHAIWLVDSSDNTVYRLPYPNHNDLDFRSAEKIAPPNKTWVYDVCTSNDVWVSGFLFSTSPNLTFSPATIVPLTVSKYSDSTKSWQTVWEASNIAPCKSLKNGDIVFWSQNEIVRFNSTDASPQYINTDWDVSYITDDLGGDLWVVNVNGEIYRQFQDTWVFVEKFSPASHLKLFVDDKGNLWVASDDKFVYKYSASDSAFSREMVFESSLGWRQDFFQDNSGSMWLVTSDSLLVQRDGQFQEVGLPPRSEILHFGIFDIALNTLFVSTEGGVFALDLDKYSP